MGAPEVVQLSVNAWVSCGPPIGGKIKCTGSVGYSVENGAKSMPMTDGTVGVSSGISVGEVSLKLMAERGSTQQKRLEQARAAGTLLSLVVNDAGLRMPFTGILGGTTMSSEPNEPVSYDVKLVGAPGDPL